MFGANLVSVQKLLGHSDPRITERRYGHLLPDFMQAEVDVEGRERGALRHRGEAADEEEVSPARRQPS